MVCLVTTFIIDILNGNKEAKNKFEKILNERELVYIASPSITEIISGSSMNMQKKEKEDAIRFISSTNILPLDKESAIEAGEIDAYLIVAGETVGIADIMIGAIAKLNDEILITRNIKHFQRIPGLKVESY